MSIMVGRRVKALRIRGACFISGDLEETGYVSKIWRALYRFDTHFLQRLEFHSNKSILRKINIDLWLSGENLDSHEGDPIVRPDDPDAAYRRIIKKFHASDWSHSLDLRR